MEKSRMSCLCHPQKGLYLYFERCRALDIEGAFSKCIGFHRRSLMLVALQFSITIQIALMENPKVPFAANIAQFCFLQHKITGNL